MVGALSSSCRWAFETDPGSAFQSDPPPGARPPAGPGGRGPTLRGERPPGGRIRSNELLGFERGENRKIETARLYIKTFSCFRCRDPRGRGASSRAVAARRSLRSRHRQHTASHSGENRKPNGRSLRRTAPKMAAFSQTTIEDPASDIARWVQHPFGCASDGFVAEHDREVSGG